MVADIRLATLEDGPSILRLMEAFNISEDIAFRPEALAASYALLMSHADWGAAFIAEVGGVPAGYAVLAYGFDFEFGGRYAFLCELFVTERDRNRGVGKELMATAEAYARNNEVQSLHLIVRRENSAAQILYRRDGFTFDPRLLMSKPLT